MTHHTLGSRRTADVPEAHETDGHAFHLKSGRFCAMVRLTVGKRCRDYTKQGPFLPKAAVAQPCATAQSPGFDANAVHAGRSAISSAALRPLGRFRRRQCGSRADRFSRQGCGGVDHAVRDRVRQFRGELISIEASLRRVGSGIAANVQISECRERHENGEGPVQRYCLFHEVVIQIGAHELVTHYAKSESYRKSQSRKSRRRAIDRCPRWNSRRTTLPLRVVTGRHEKEILTNIYKTSLTDGDNNGLTNVILTHW